MKYLLIISTVWAINASLFFGTLWLGAFFIDEARVTDNMQTAWVTCCWSFGLAKVVLSFLLVSQFLDQPAHGDRS